jgi:cytochrome b561
MLRFVNARYGAVAMSLHWLTVALVFANLTLGISMVPLPLSPRKLQWYAWHKWIGITVFIVTCLRLAWRASHRPPPLVPMPDWQRRAADRSHVLLYVLLTLIPLSGWLYSSSTGVQVVYLGLVPLPDLVPKDRTLATVLKWTHYGLNSALFALVVVHAAAALKHHFVDRDRTLARMLPAAWTRSRGS